MSRLSYLGDEEHNDVGMKNHEKWSRSKALKMIEDWEGNKFGAAMALVKSDIGGNISNKKLEGTKEQHFLKLIGSSVDDQITFGKLEEIFCHFLLFHLQRLEDKYSSNPTEFNLLYSMVEVEVAAKTAKGSSSCTNGLLWLTRAMEFLVELFHNLLQHPDWTMSQVCTDSYGKTLKQWHGWLASSSFSLAMKLAPDRKKFMDVISGTGDVNADMEAFCTSFSPFLEENHKFLVRCPVLWWR
ncbi:Glycolipid transfer protein 1 [Vitis vinifera]|uniref:Glycolipid transfer protein 1 n=1 Tax=Vitis vinifera TaxID=29760 RepID=A0A438CTM3_VITVI|nr:Glycolipid transfer protein 1 [Vitis vinifera]